MVKHMSTLHSVPALMATTEIAHATQTAQEALQVILEKCKN